jgi:hypothetical protein
MINPEKGPQALKLVKGGLEPFTLNVPINQYREFTKTVAKQISEGNFEKLERDEPGFFENRFKHTRGVYGDVQRGLESAKQELQRLNERKEEVSSNGVMKRIVEIQDALEYLPPPEYPGIQEVRDRLNAELTMLERENSLAIMQKTKASLEKEIPALETEVGEIQKELSHSYEVLMRDGTASDAKRKKFKQFIEAAGVEILLQTMSRVS